MGRGLAFEPPRKFDPGRLFRLLAHPDRPRLPISHRIRGAENVPLEVRAPTCCEFHEALEAPEHPDGMPWRAIIAATVWSGDRRAFGISGVSVGQLTEAEFKHLRDQVRKALDVIAPMAGRCNEPAWIAALAQGAAHTFNRRQTGLMAASRDLVIGYSSSVRMFRPDRYYGKPLAQLTDGQVMAYSAACDLIDKEHG